MLKKPDFGPFYIMEKFLWKQLFARYVDIHTLFAEWSLGADRLRGLIKADKINLNAFGAHNIKRL